MLALRSTLLAATRTCPAQLARRASTVESSVASDILSTVSHPDGPPTAGPDGYPPSQQKSKTHPHMLSTKPKYRLHCKSTRNNTIMTFTEPNGNTLAWFSGGSCGFKKVNRSGYEAGYQCAIRIFKRIEQVAEKQPIDVELFVKGFGQGREALQKALTMSEGEKVRPLVTRITDRTPIKIGGTRAKKARRL